MLLGVRALIAAGAESVMVLYTSRQAIFRPMRSSTGELLNASELEHYLIQVQLQGKVFISMLHRLFSQLSLSSVCMKETSLKKFHTGNMLKHLQG